MPARAELLTTALGLAFLATLYAGWVSWRAVRDWPRSGDARPPLWGRRWRWPVAALVAVAVVAVGWARTEGGAEFWAGRAVDLVNLVAVSDPEERDTMGYLRRCHPKDFGEDEAAAQPDCLDVHGEALPRDVVQERRIAAIWWIPSDDHLALRGLRALLGDRLDGPMEDLDGNWIGGWSPLAPTKLWRVEMVDVPPDWRTPETARHAFRQAWCGREGLATPVCDHLATADRPVTAAVWLDRTAWCGAHDIAAEADCRAHFADLDARFEAAWTEERDAALASLPRLNLAGRDLRGADAEGATLIRANLSGARLEGATLSRAQLEGAVLSGARLEGAVLVEARLEDANLREARLEGAYLREARLERADLFLARLEGATLSGARLEGANLVGAWLKKAHLDGARLEGAKLRNANFADADLRTSRDLTQAQLEGVIGNDGTLLPDRPNDSGEPYYVWSCAEYPQELEGGRAMLIAPAELRDEFLCGPDNPRRKVGTPWPVDAPRPLGHPLAERD